MEESIFPSSKSNGNREAFPFGKASFYNIMHFKAPKFQIGGSSFDVIPKIAW